MHDKRPYTPKPSDEADIILPTAPKAKGLISEMQRNLNSFNKLQGSDSRVARSID
jgi:hypothetical protein